MSLTSYDLVAAFRGAAELAQAVAGHPPEACGDATAGPPGADPEEGWDLDRAGHQALDTIEEAANRLKRVLGARGPLAVADVAYADGPPTWEGFRGQFKYAAHPAAARQALWKLANAAADLSGYAALRVGDPALRGRGLRLLRQGLAQLWGGLAAPQREQLRPLLAPAQAAVGWPPDPAGDPPPYDGPARLADEDSYRLIDLTGGFVTRPAGFLQEQQRALSEALRRAPPGGPPSRPPADGPGAGPAVPPDAGRLRRAAEALEEVFEDERWPPGEARFARRALVERLRGRGVTRAAAEAVIEGLVRREVFRAGESSARLNLFVRPDGQPAGPVAPDRYLRTTRALWGRYVAGRRREEQSPRPLPGRRRATGPKAAKVRRDPKLEARDRWIYRQCCKGTAYDAIVAQLKRLAPQRGWRVVSSKQRVRQVGAEYARRHGQPEPPPRQNL